MEGIADYKANADVNKRSLHGLKAGDVLSGGMGSDKEVAAVDDDGVMFTDGKVTDHHTLAHNIEQVGAKIYKA